MWCFCAISGAVCNIPHGWEVLLCQQREYRQFPGALTVAVHTIAWKDSLGPESEMTVARFRSVETVWLNRSFTNLGAPHSEQTSFFPFRCSHCWFCWSCLVAFTTAYAEVLLEWDLIWMSLRVHSGHSQSAECIQWPSVLNRWNVLLFH